MATKTASFLNAPMPPGAMEMQQLGTEQQALLEALKAQSEGMAPAPTSAGRYNVLNLQGLANTLAQVRTKADLETSRKKQADLVGASQKALLEALARYNKDDPASITEARNSPHEMLRERAENDLKARREVAGKVADRGSFTSVTANLDNPAAWQPKQTQQFDQGAVVGLTEGQAPTLLSGQMVPGKLADGTEIDTNPLTGKRDAVNRAPTVRVTNVNDKADAAGAAEAVKATLARADELRRVGTGQVRALASMEESAKQGAFQGPLQNWQQQAYGLATQFGLTGEEAKRLLSNTEALKSDSGKFVLAIVRQLGTNPSNADRTYSEQTAGGAQLSPQGLMRVIRAARADLANTINEHNAQVDVGAKTGVRSYELGRIRMPLWRKGDLDGFEPDAQGTYMPVISAPAGGAPNMADYLPGGRFYGKP